MKTYIEKEEALLTDNSYIPKGHRLYLEALEEVEQGLAVIEPYVAPDTRPQEERTWRDAELAKADIELNKVQDGRGTGLVSDWRDYRNELRDWPEHESFPDSAFRPDFVNTDT
jgi:hypothetical protein